MTSPIARPRPRLLPVLALLMPVGCLVWAFWTTFLDLALNWRTNPQSSHGYLVPGFALLLLWLRRGRLDLTECHPSWWGVPLLAAGIGVRLVGVFYYYMWLDSITLIPCLAGLILMLGGRAAWRWAGPAVLFLAFMIPLPYRLATALAGPLQGLATVTSTFIMQTVGLPALAEGYVIKLNDDAINIVEACSGLRMLVVFVALATAVTLVIRRPWLDRLIILASAVPIALISNIARITATGVLHESVSSATAHAFFHDVAGWLMMPLALGLLWVELQVLSYLFIDLPPAPPRGPRAPSPRRAPRPAPAGGDLARAPRSRPLTPPRKRERPAAPAQAPAEPTAEKT